MLGASQASAPQDQGRDPRTILTRSPEKPAPKPQREGCSSSGDLRGPKGGRGREPSPASGSHYHFIAELQVFDQLGLTTKERKIATEALVSIASGAGVECFSIEIPEDRALL